MRRRKEQRSGMCYFERKPLSAGAGKVRSNCIILEVKMAHRRWKQLASLIRVMNNAHRASMGLKRTQQGVYQIALSVRLHIGVTAVAARIGLQNRISEIVDFPDNGAL